MASASKILHTAQTSPQSVTFSELKKLIVAIGFNHVRTNGSHVIYVKAGVEEIINIQPRKHDTRTAKIYQVEQIVDIIAKYGIEV